MEKYKESKGFFPEPLFIRSEADDSHYIHVEEKYGSDYYKIQ